MCCRPNQIAKQGSKNEKKNNHINYISKYTSLGRVQHGDNDHSFRERQNKERWTGNESKQSMQKKQILQRQGQVMQKAQTGNRKSWWSMQKQKYISEEQAGVMKSNTHTREGCLVSQGERETEKVQEGCERESLLVLVTQECRAAAQWFTLWLQPRSHTKVRASFKLPATVQCHFLCLSKAQLIAFCSNVSTCVWALVPLPIPPGPARTCVTLKHKACVVREYVHECAPLSKTPILKHLYDHTGTISTVTVLE